MIWLTPECRYFADRIFNHVRTTDHLCNVITLPDNLHCFELENRIFISLVRKPARPETARSVHGGNPARNTMRCKFLRRKAYTSSLSMIALIRVRTAPDCIRSSLVDKCCGSTIAASTPYSSQGATIAPVKSQRLTTSGRLLSFCFTANGLHQRVKQCR